MITLPRLTKPQIVIVLGDAGLVAVALGERGKCANCFVVLNDAKAASALRDFLARYPEQPVVLLSNQLAQDYRAETLPRLNPVDRKRLIKRRLRAAFPQADLTAFLPDPSDKRSILGIGLPVNGSLLRWLEILHHRHPKLALLPVECASAAAVLSMGLTKEWALLLTRHESGGLRQIVTRKGALVFTRLTPSLADDDDTGALLQQMRQDVRATVDYLGRHGLPDKAALAITAIVPEKIGRRLEAILAHDGPMQMLTLAEAAKRLKLEMPGEEEHFSDVLLGSWVAQQAALKLVFRTPALLAAAREKTLQRWGLRAATAGLAAAIILTGHLTLQLVGDCATLRKHRTDLTQLLAQQNQMRLTVTPPSEPMGRLRMALERKQMFAAANDPPWALLKQVHQGLGGDGWVTQLDWQVTAAKVHEQLRLNVKLDDKLLATHPDKRQIVTSYETMVRNLAQDAEGYKVTLTRYPFPALPQDILSSDYSLKSDDAKMVSAEITLQKIRP